MSSREYGFATATLELMSGYPGYFYSPGNGSYIFAVDEKYGLPMRLCGDAGPDIAWIGGFNQGVIAHIEKHGVPWNSRLSALAVLSDLSGYFHQRTQQSVRVELNGVTFRPEGFGFALSLVESGFIGRTRTSVRLESNSLFGDPKIVPDAMGAYRSGPPPTGIPALSRPPALKSGTEEIWLRHGGGAQCIECVPAPLGSHLVVFRFSDFTPSPGRSKEAEESFVALDAQLADWLPEPLSRRLNQ